MKPVTYPAHREGNTESADINSTWTIPQLLEATGGQLVHGLSTGPIDGISIDTRSMLPRQAYVAIRGKRYDGHRFVEEAARRNAACLIVSDIPKKIEATYRPSVIQVADTTEVLGDIARYHRRRLNLPIIAVTGSCGKTTTKDMIAHLITGSTSVHKSRGTWNNQIGVPLTLLGLTSVHQMGVVELGSNHPGEIAYLASIAEPKIAVVTNVGPSHLEFFGSMMEVMREKLSLLDALPHDGTVVLPGDQLDVCLEAQQFLKPGVRVVTFGTTDRCDIQAVDVHRTDNGMQFRLRDHLGQWTMFLMGYHNVENILAAIACAWAMGLPLSILRRRLSSLAVIPMRSQVMRCEGLTILNDCYNANPLSFARALETLRDLTVRRRVVIVGDMLELGSFASVAHRAIGRLAVQMGIDEIIAVGDYVDEVAAGVNEVNPNGIETFRTVRELLDRLPEILQEGDGILIKGSRKLNLEQVTDFLLNRYKKANGDFAQ